MAEPDSEPDPDHDRGPNRESDPEPDCKPETSREPEPGREANPEPEPSRESNPEPSTESDRGERRSRQAGRSTGHYFETRPGAASRPRTLDVNIDGRHLRFVTDSGVFSPGRLDPGTRLLLLEAPPLAADERRVLDLGCGWGPVACTVALRSTEAQVIAVDVNERALTLTARNAAANGASNVTVARPDAVDSEARFDRILCNPPVRVGKPALYEMLGHWLDRLAPPGRAHFVVHRHLGSDSLARWLQARGHPVARLVSRSGYRILEVAALADGAR